MSAPTRALFVPFALAALSMIGAPAQADVVRDHRGGAEVRDHRRTSVVRPAPPRRVAPRTIITPPAPRARRADDSYRYDPYRDHRRAPTQLHAPVHYRDTASHAWVPGSWQWYGGQWVWTEGHWVALHGVYADPGPSWVHPRDRASQPADGWLRN